MNRFYLIILLSLLHSCVIPDCEQSAPREWIIEVLEKPFTKTLENYDLLATKNLTGAVDWFNLKQQEIINVDIWNLYDGILIDSMIIYDSNTILAREHSTSTCRPNWFVFNLHKETLNDKFIDQKESKVINSNWKTYKNKPVAKKNRKEKLP